MPDFSTDNTALVPATEPSGRDVDTVPFVELFGGRLQGVVSASSDPNRVYCAFLEAGTGNYYSSTNNNRPDAGMAKRLRWLIEQAERQFGPERLGHYMQMTNAKGQVALRYGRQTPEPAGTVFSRFLNYLRFVDLPPVPGPVPEMSWFVAGPTLDEAE